MALTPLDWFLWAVCVATQVVALERSRSGSFRSLSVLMVYLLSESALLFPLSFGPCERYSCVYYLAGLGENVLLAVVAIELAGKLLPHYRKLVMRIGPVTVAGPAFLTLIVLPPVKVESLLRLGTVAMFFSLVLLLVCFAFEQAPPDVRRLSCAYTGLLALLAICAEVQLRGGLNPETVRRLWPLAWIVGVGAVAFTLPRKHKNVRELRKADDSLLVV